ncbi:chemotaxis protein CheB [Chamaesiphon sp.]|uniref:chemotaxis protein CheB n=1 Tax=Chamaesiphon sp. TaxID=2814140 RepID=UPI00359441D5
MTLDPLSQQPSESPTPAYTALFPIVGIAASAGGLEAFLELVSNLPIDTGMAFVLIQHLAPDTKSLLTEILAKATPMPVQEVTAGMRVEPNQIYVIPPNTKMIVAAGTLQLSARERVSGQYMPGDSFFTSLAEDCGHKAIAIVLSGGDGDGSLGLTAIKAAGGVTFAQCKDTARVNSMPSRAIATGNVDFVLPPAAIAAQLVRLSTEPILSAPLLTLADESAPTDGLIQIFALLRAATGVDFSYYKSSTISRRIQRRMLLLRLERLDEYASYLTNDPAEVKALYQEITIHVTSFFRDPEAFELLKTQVLPQLLRHKSPESSMRIWVPGCSTGEEVYSIAICLLEVLALADTPPLQRLPIQIFATDISDLAIDKARSGIYTENQMVDISPERRRRFFNAIEGNRYQIGKSIRELCVFARQNLGGDPPFSNLDLISCRNVLIYLGESLQKRIIPIFHYSLNSTGFLLLGTSESTGTSDLFHNIDKKYRIYTKNLTVNLPTFSLTPSSYPAVKLHDRQPLTAPADRFDLQQQVDRAIAAHYAPTGVVINNQMQVLHMRGEIDRYLQLRSGVADFNIFKLVRFSTTETTSTDLRIELRAAIYQAQRQDCPVTKQGIAIEIDRRIDLQVIPFKVPTTEAYCFLILFEEALPIRTIQPISIEPVNPQGDLERENMRLRQELDAAILELNTTQEYLEAVIIEHERSDSDLKTANEEILSSNEEMQSTNEELETAQEEIQATNEELTITNDELRSRNRELYRLTNDLTNLLGSINIAIVMLTDDLRIRRFTPMAQRLFNLLPADTHRHLSDIRSNLDLPDLEQAIVEVQETLGTKTLEVQTRSGHWYMLTIRPYRTTENQIDGVVLVLHDINAFKRALATVEAARNYAEEIVETVQVPLLVLESDFRINKANRAFYQTFQVEWLETIRASLFELGNGQWNIPRLRPLLEGILTATTTVENIEVEHQFEQIGTKIMLLNAVKIAEVGASQRILLSIEDITARKQFERESLQLLTAQLARQEAETANRAKDEFLSNLSHELRNPLSAIIGWAQLLTARQLDEPTVRRALDSIYRSARAQSRLIEDMLDISRIDSGQLRLNTLRLDLVSVVNAAIDSVQLAADAKSLQISSRLTSTMFVGDLDRLHQVLCNLLSNAIKFTPTGGRVEITLVPLPDRAEIRVSDTGIGISAELLPHIFDRFRQGDNGTNKANQGLGLGLAIARQIVELHGGTIRAESPGVGQGTTLIVSLPQRSIPALPAAIEPTTVPLPQLTTELPSLSSLQLLSVDDDPDLLELMKYLLESVGAQVTSVTSARAAIAALTAEPDKYDALLVDLGMPDEDGLALLAHVRGSERESIAQIPAVAVTAYVSDLQRRLAIAAGFQLHLAKPIDPTQLIQAVASLTGRG